MLTTVTTSGLPLTSNTRLSLVNISINTVFSLVRYGTLQFDAYDEIREVGYYHGKTYFAGLRKAGQLWFMSPPTGLDNRRGSLEQLGPSSVARFTDLAEMVCR